MSVNQIPRREKVVPKLYEEDTSKYAGPHRLQLSYPARMLRRQFKQHAYLQWTKDFTTITTQGTEHLDALDGPAIFIGNHTSHLDTILTQAALPEKVTDSLFYGAAQDRWFVKGRKKKELNPLYQSFILGTFPIMRGGGIQALSYASQILERGQHIFLFPEGTRAMDGELGAFKHGATLLALRHQVPVVPLYLSGLGAIRPKGQRTATPGPVGLDILEPQRFAPGTELETATGQLWSALNEVHQHYNPATEEAQTADSHKAA